MSKVGLDTKIPNKSNYNDENENDTSVEKNSNDKERETKDKQSIAHTKLKLLKQDHHTSTLSERLNNQQKNNNDQSEKSSDKLQNLTQENPSNKESKEQKDTNTQAQSVISFDKKTNTANKLSRAARAAPAFQQRNKQSDGDILANPVAQPILDNNQATKVPGRMVDLIPKLQHALFDPTKEDEWIEEYSGVLGVVTGAPVVTKSANKIQTDLDYFKDEIIKRAKNNISDNERKISLLEDRDNWNSEEKDYKNNDYVKERVANIRRNDEVFLNALKAQSQQKIERHRREHQIYVREAEDERQLGKNALEALKRQLIENGNYDESSHQNRLDNLDTEYDDKVDVSRRKRDDKILAEEEHIVTRHKAIKEQSAEQIKQLETPESIKNKIKDLEQENRQNQAEIDGDQRDKLRLARRLVKSESWRKGEAGAAFINGVVTLLDPKASVEAKASAALTFAGETLRGVSAELDLKRAAREKAWELKKKAFDQQQESLPENQRKANPYDDNPYKKPSSIQDIDKVYDKKLTSEQLSKKNTEIQALKDRFKAQNPAGTDLTEGQLREIDAKKNSLYSELLGEKQALQRQKDILENGGVTRNRTTFDEEMKKRQELKQSKLNAKFRQSLSLNQQESLSGKIEEINNKEVSGTEKFRQISQLENDFLSKELPREQQLKYVGATEKLKRDHSPNGDYHKRRTTVQNQAKVATLANSVFNALGNVVGAVDDARNLYDENGNIDEKRVFSLVNNVVGTAVQTGLTLSVGAKTFAKTAVAAATAQTATRTLSTVGQVSGLFSGPLGIWSGIEGLQNGQHVSGGLAVTGGALLTIQGGAALGAAVASATGASTAAGVLGAVATGAGWIAAPIAVAGLGVLATDATIGRDFNQPRMESAKKAFAGETYSHSYAAVQKKQREDTLEQRAKAIAQKHGGIPRIAITNDPQVDQILNAHPSRTFGEAHLETWNKDSHGFGYSATTGIPSTSESQGNGFWKINTDIVPLAVDLENSAAQIDQQISHHRVRRGGAWQVGTLAGLGTQQASLFREATEELTVNGQPAEIETKKDFIVNNMGFGTHNVVLIDGLQPRESSVYSTGEKSLMNQHDELVSLSRLTDEQRQTLFKTGTVSIPGVRTLGNLRPGSPVPDEVLTFRVNHAENNKNNELASTTAGHKDNPFTPRVVATSTKHPSIVSLSNIQRPTEVTIRNDGDIVEVEGTLSKPLLLDVTQVSNTGAFNKIDLRGYRHDDGFNFETTYNVLKGPGLSHFDSSREDGLNFGQAPNQQVTREEIVRIPTDDSFVLVKLRPDQRLLDIVSV
ncbi:hypothetical protein [Veronia pacifica]|uniref:Uncharacterized protein n=1 Tax=Veronia pacifica TaxID=1080227 RepID=A0A1C3EIM9_9GAMM|nr:hypothetical protein [Veronia pacifica]ODA33078.1 hypothetical protein A8L45_11585 [Veronia pacifica]